LNEYFLYIHKTFVAELLELSKQLTKERKKLMQSLFMEELDLLHEHPYKPGKL
jgi:mRNA-degrading endonuclease RelE of RelBE toxin-antitoxin system